MYKILEAPRGLPSRFYRYFIFINIGYICSFLVHGFNVALFSYLEVPLLVTHNVISMAVFAVVIVINRSGYFFTALTIAILEFISHAVFVTWLIGWESGYTHYLFFLAVTAYLAPAGKKYAKALLVACTCAAYLGLTVYSRSNPPVHRIAEDVIAAMNILNIIAIFALLALLSYYYRSAADRAEEALEMEFRRSEELLHNILPVEIAERLKADSGTIADRQEACSVIFADLVGFTALSDRTSPERLVEILNGLFTVFDDIIEKNGLEKIKTIGDSYMIASGLPHPRDDHAEAAAACALGMLRATGDYNERTGLSLQIRIGINSGPVVAGVIGRKKFTYDLWGDTVNLASRLEYHGIPGKIQVSEHTRDLLRGSYDCVFRERIAVKGKGEIDTYLLVG
jgi:adenylate cyclase